MNASTICIMLTIVVYLLLVLVVGFPCGTFCYYRGKSCN